MWLLLMCSCALPVQSSQLVLHCVRHLLLAFRARSSLLTCCLLLLPACLPLPCPLQVKQVSAPEAGRLAVAVKSSKDERYGCHWVVTHDGRCMRCFTADSLAQFRDQLGPAYHKLAVLAIDEAQFFPDLAEFCAEAVDRDGKHVIVAGLSGDFRRQRFGQLTELMPLADSIRQLTSKCAFCSAE